MQQQAEYPQCRIVPMRFLNPETTEKLLKKIVTVPGVRRILLNGQNIPVMVPYGPARGRKNAHSMRKTVEIAGTPVNLNVQVGYITLELEDKSVIDAVQPVCDEIFTKFPYYIQDGRFMKTRSSVVDYAKYGPNPDPSIIGLVDPKRKEQPVLIQPSGSPICKGEF
ncbi:MAG: methyl-coenzyme M reductase operon protein D [Methanoregulaceae archaeon]